MCSQFALGVLLFYAVGIVLLFKGILAFKIRFEVLSVYVHYSCDKLNDHHAVLSGMTKVINLRQISKPVFEPNRG
jgi:hypothetical protein